MQKEHAGPGGRSANDTLTLPIPERCDSTDVVIRYLTTRVSVPVFLMWFVYSDCELLVGEYTSDYKENYSYR